MYERKAADYIEKLPAGKHSTKGLGKSYNPIFLSPTLRIVDIVYTNFYFEPCILTCVELFSISALLSGFCAMNECFNMRFSVYISGQVAG